MIPSLAVALGLLALVPIAVKRFKAARSAA